MRVMMKIEYKKGDDHEEGDDEDDDGDYERKAETKSEWWGLDMQEAERHTGDQQS